MKKKGRFLKAFICISLSFILVLTGFAVYVSDYYRADTSREAFSFSETAVTFYENDNLCFFTPQKAEAAVIFYPGGKVESKAYYPLMYALAEKNIACILVEMPFNLAVFNIDAADGIKELLNGIEDWYIAGHSLGGSMAAEYLCKNTVQYKGLILLASYSAADISDTEAEVLSIYGSEDGILDREKYNKNKANLPDNFTEFVIDGGCHAYFAVYGEQKGDGKPAITDKEQIEITAEITADFILKS